MRLLRIIGGVSAITLGLSGCGGVQTSSELATLSMGDFILKIGIN